ncbi:hypothetical protein HDU88_005313 [Geranomyces variabilis]|nr:hypothetical protein HDU88_005313 [Geranomyces variabilis]
MRSDDRGKRRLSTPTAAPRLNSNSSPSTPRIAIGFHACGFDFGLTSPNVSFAQSGQNATSAEPLQQSTDRETDATDLGFGQSESADHCERKDEVPWPETPSRSAGPGAPAAVSDIKILLPAPSSNSVKIGSQSDSAELLQQLEQKLANTETERDTALRDLASLKDAITGMKANETELIAERDRLKHLERRVIVDQLKFARDLRAAEDRKREDDEVKMRQVDMLAATCEQIDSSHRITIDQQAREIKILEAAKLEWEEERNSLMLAAQKAATTLRAPSVKEAELEEAMLAASTSAARNAAEKDMAVSAMLAAQEVATKLGAEVAMLKEADSKLRKEKETLTVLLSEKGAIIEDALRAQSEWTREKDLLVADLNAEITKLAHATRDAQNEKNLAISSLIAAQDAATKLGAEVAILKEAESKSCQEKESLTVLLSEKAAIIEEALRAQSEWTREKDLLVADLNAEITKLAHATRNAQNEKNLAISSLIAAQEAAAKLSAEVVMLKEADSKSSKEKETLNVSLAEKIAIIEEASRARDLLVASLTEEKKALTLSLSEKGAIIEETLRAQNESTRERDLLVASLTEENKALGLLLAEKGAIIEKASRAQAEWTRERDLLTASLTEEKDTSASLLTEKAAIFEEALRAQAEWTCERDLLVASSTEEKETLASLLAEKGAILEKALRAQAEWTREKDLLVASLTEEKEALSSSLAEKDVIIEEALRAQGEWTRERDLLVASQHNLALSRDELQVTADMLATRLREAQIEWETEREAFKLSQKMLTESRDEMRKKVDQLCGETLALTASLGSANDAVRHFEEIEKLDRERRAAHEQLAEDTFSRIEQLERARGEAEAKVADLTADVTNLTHARNEAWLAGEKLCKLYEHLVLDLDDCTNEATGLRIENHELRCLNEALASDISVLTTRHREIVYARDEAEAALQQTLHDTGVHEGIRIERDALKNDVADKMKTIQQLGEQLATLVHERELLQQAHLAEIRAARDKADAAAAQAKDYAAEVVIKTNTSQQLSEQLAALVREHESLQQAHLVEMKATRAEVDVATAQEKERAAEVVELSEQLGTLAREHELLQQAHLAEMKATRAEVDVATAQEKDRAAEVVELSEKLATLAREHESLQQAHLEEMKAARAEVDVATAQENDRAAEVAKLSEKLAALAREHESLQQAHSAEMKAARAEADVATAQAKDRAAEVAKLREQLAALVRESESLQQAQLAESRAAGKSVDTATTQGKARAVQVAELCGDNVENQTPKRAADDVTSDPKTPAPKEEEAPALPVSHVKRSRETQESPQPRKKQARDVTTSEPGSSPHAGTPTKPGPPAEIGRSAQPDAVTPRRPRQRWICTSSFKPGTPFDDKLEADLFDCVRRFQGTHVARPKPGVLWSRGITHLVTPASARTLKTFAATLSKKCWIITDPAWISESKAAGRWLPEKDYGWRNNAPNPFGSAKFWIADSFRAGAEYHEQSARCLLDIAGNLIVEKAEDADVVLCAAGDRDQYPGKAWEFQDFMRRIPGIDGASRGAKDGSAEGRILLQREDPESRRARIRMLFEALDDNKTGYLDHDNILRRLDELAARSRARAERKAKRAKQQHMSAEQPLPPPKHQHRQKPPDCKKERGPRDVPIGSKLMYASELIKECDKTKDGRISFPEFENFVHQKEAELEKVFRQIDSSGDNTIQPQELRQYVSAAGIPVTDDDIQTLLNRFETSEAGITYDEWRDFLLLLPRTATPQNIFNYLNSIYNVDVNSDSMPFPDNVRGTDSVVHQRIRYFLCGGLSGAVSRTVTAPLDRLKVLLVTQTTIYPSPLGAINSAPANVPAAPTSGAIIGGIRRIYQQGGIRSFYRGNGINVMKIAPESGMKFFTFETMKNAVARAEGVNHADYISVPGRFLAGGIAGLISQFTIYPLETVKTRIMAQIAEGSTSTASPPLKTADPPPSASRAATQRLLMSTIRQMYKENGIRAFYRGCIPSLIGIVPYAGIDLGTYETLRSGYEKRLRQKTGNKDAKAGSLRLLGFGAVSAATGAVIMYPLSVIRTRLQAQGTPSHPYTYKNSFDVIRKTYAREGMFGFYKGLAPTLLKVIPAVSVAYVVYERAKTMI